MNSKAILGASIAIVFVFAMTSNPVLAVSPAFDITSAAGFSMTIAGNPGTATEGHDVIVYAFITDTPGAVPNSSVAYVAAVHPSFNDDPAEQTPGNKKIHGHAVDLDNTTLCVVGISNNPTVTVTGKTVSIDGVGNVVLHAIAGYDATAGGLCPTELYDAI